MTDVVDKVDKQPENTQPICITFASANPIVHQLSDENSTYIPLLNLNYELVTYTNNLSGRIKVKVRTHTGLDFNLFKKLICTEKNSNRYTPHILHISFHGDQSGSILFHSSEPELPFVADLQTDTEIDKIISVSSPILPHLVVLQGCYSKKIAEKLVQRGVRFAIGAPGEIDDTQSTKFLKSFYTRLFSPRNNNSNNNNNAIDVKTAWDQMNSTDGTFSLIHDSSTKNELFQPPEDNGLLSSEPAEYNAVKHSTSLPTTTLCLTYLPMLQNVLTSCQLHHPGLALISFCHPRSTFMHNNNLLTNCSLNDLDKMQSGRTFSAQILQAYIGHVSSYRIARIVSMSVNVSNFSIDDFIKEFGKEVKHGHEKVQKEIEYFKEDQYYQDIGSFRDRLLIVINGLSKVPIGESSFVLSKISDFFTNNNHLSNTMVIATTNNDGDDKPRDVRWTYIYSQYLKKQEAIAYFRSQIVQKLEKNIRERDSILQLVEEPTQLHGTIEHLEKCLQKLDIFANFKDNITFGHLNNMAQRYIDGKKQLIELKWSLLQQQQDDLFQPQQQQQPQQQPQHLQQQLDDPDLFIDEQDLNQLLELTKTLTSGVDGNICRRK